tara:strand:- start:235 stop:618 length:384 start_codon:yes stop_codon:yes gene_type:complete
LLGFFFLGGVDLGDILFNNSTGDNNCGDGLLVSCVVVEIISGVDGVDGVGAEVDASVVEVDADAGVAVENVVAAVFVKSISSSATISTSIVAAIVTVFVGIDTGSLVVAMDIFVVEFVVGFEMGPNI